MSRAEPLSGHGVLVTRPAHQADGLCRLIEQAGGRAIRFPVIEILPGTHPEQAQRHFAQLSDKHILIFISANAVRFAQTYLSTLQASPRIAAIGKATARALQSAGINVHIQAENGYDSEALLGHPAMQQVVDTPILIVRGEGGREKLADTLRSRQAQVDYAEVYRRRQPACDPQPIIDAWREKRFETIVVTSGEGLKNLAAMLGDAGRRCLTESRLVVVSRRIVEQAEALGIGRITLAASPADEDLLQAITDSIGQFR